MWNKFKNYIEKNNLTNQYNNIMTLWTILLTKICSLGEGNDEF